VNTLHSTIRRAVRLGGRGLRHGLLASIWPSFRSSAERSASWSASPFPTASSGCSLTGWSSVSCWAGLRSGRNRHRQEPRARVLLSEALWGRGLSPDKRFQRTATRRYSEGGAAVRRWSARRWYEMACQPLSVSRRSKRSTDGC